MMRGLPSLVCFAGCAAALGTAAIVIAMWAWIFPVQYDWNDLKYINLEEAETEGGPPLLTSMPRHMPCPASTG